MFLNENWVNLSPTLLIKQALLQLIQVVQNTFSVERRSCLIDEYSTLCAAISFCPACQEVVVSFYVSLGNKIRAFFVEKACHISADAIAPHLLDFKRCIPEAGACIVLAGILDMINLVNHLTDSAAVTIRNKYRFWLLFEAFSLDYPSCCGWFRFYLRYRYFDDSNLTVFT